MKSISYSYKEIEANINGKTYRRCFKNNKRVKCRKNTTKKMYTDVFDPIYYSLFPKKANNSKRRKNK